MAKTKKEEMVVEASKVEFKPECSPSKSSPEWHDFIMSEFREDELRDGKYPSCDGLRRLFEKYVGAITEVNIEVIQPAMVANANRTTVKCTVKCQGSLGLLSYSDVADASDYNYAEPYNMYPTATAATSAEGRVYRKALGIRAVCSEEMGKIDRVGADKFNSQFQPMNESQAMAANTIAEGLSIDLDKLAKYLKFDSFKVMTYDGAQSLLQTLNSYQRNKDSIPKEVVRD